MAAVGQRLAALRDRRGPEAWRRCEAVRRLVVVCASSRGGSSLFGQLLRLAGRGTGLRVLQSELGLALGYPRAGAPRPITWRGGLTTQWPQLTSILEDRGVRELAVELGHAPIPPRGGNGCRRRA